MKAKRRSKLPEALRRTLDRYRRRRRLVTAQRGFFLTLVISIVAVGAAVALDRWLRLGATSRIIFAGAIGLVALWLLFSRVIRPVFRKMSDRRAAAALGEHFPDMKEDLVSGVELSGIQNKQDEEGFSHSLIMSAIRNIADRASRIDPRLAVSLRPVLKVIGILVIVGLLFQGAYLLHREPIRNALRRLFQPTEEVGFFSYTNVHVQPGDHIIRTGDTFEVVITTSGREAEEARLEVRKKSGPFRTRMPFEQGEARWWSSPLFEEIDYRAVAGDGISDWFHVRVVPPPVLRSKSAVLRDPEYAGGQERTLEKIQGPVQIVQGTAVQLRVEPVKRGTDDRLACMGELVCPGAKPREPKADTRDGAVQGVSDGPIGADPEKLEPWWPELEAKLEQQVSFDFKDKTLTDALIDLAKTADAPIVLDEEALAAPDNPNITLKVTNMKLGQALDWIGGLVNMKYTLKDEAIYVSAEERLVRDDWLEHKAAADRKAAEAERAEVWLPLLEAKLKEKLSVGFTETPLRDVVDFLQQNADATIVLDEAAVAEVGDPKITLKLDDVELGEILDRIVKMASLKYVLRNEAFFISSKEKAGQDAREKFRGPEGVAAEGKDDEKAQEQRFAMDREGEMLISSLFTPTVSGEYLVELVDGYGLRNRTPQSVFIRLVADKLPRVKIKSPAQDMFVMESERIVVEAVAEDELGLRGIDLTYRIGRGKEHRMWQGRRTRLNIKEGGIEVRKITAKATLDVAKLGLNPGDALEYRAEAADYADTAEMRRGISPEFRITVITEEQHLQQALMQLRDIRIELLKRAHDQQQQATEAAELAETAKENPVNSEARQAQDSERELARNVGAIAKSVDTLVPDLLRNPSATAELISGLEKLGRAIRSLSKGKMITNAEQFGETADVEPGPDRAAKQAALLKQAQQTGMEIAAQLRRLADEAARLQRSGSLSDLADLAELLAARQWEVMHSTLKVGVSTIGAGPADLPKELKIATQRLFASENTIHAGCERLSEGIRAALSNLAYAEPVQAEVARRAGNKLKAGNVIEVTGALAENMKRNVLFCELPRQKEVAECLDEVAKILSGTDSSRFSSIATQLQEFIRRQIEINTNIITAGIYKRAAAQDGRVVGGKQKGLERDVLEQANALYWLAQEVYSFEMQTPKRLEAAAAEMNAGALCLDTLKFPKGLEHGRKALALLMDASNTFGEEFGDMEESWGIAMSMEGALLLMRILEAQKQLIKTTAAADELAAEDFEAFIPVVVKLAEKQSSIRIDTRRLEKLLVGIPGAVNLVQLAGDKMDISRQALDSGDAGRETRVVQRQALALLEQLFGEVSAAMGEMGLMGARGMAMMMALTSSGQGFAGGGNAPILPATVGEMPDEGWRKVRTRFEGQLASDFEAEYPPEFRKLLEAYFGRLRSEPLR